MPSPPHFRAGPMANHRSRPCGPHPRGGLPLTQPTVRYYKLCLLLRHDPSRRRSGHRPDTARCHCALLEQTPPRFRRTRPQRLPPGPELLRTQRLGPTRPARPLCRRLRRQHLPPSHRLAHRPLRLGRNLPGTLPRRLTLRHGGSPAHPRRPCRRGLGAPPVTRTARYAAARDHSQIFFFITQRSFVPLRQGPSGPSMLGFP